MGRARRHDKPVDHATGDHSRHPMAKHHSMWHYRRAPERCTQHSGFLRNADYLVKHPGEADFRCPAWKSKPYGSCRRQAPRPCVAAHSSARVSWGNTANVRDGRPFGTWLAPSTNAQGPAGSDAQFLVLDEKSVTSGGPHLSKTAKVAALSAGL